MAVLAQPFRHPKTGIYYFRRVIPEALRLTVGKREWKKSLRTKLLAEAKQRYLFAAQECEAAFEIARGRTFIAPAFSCAAPAGTVDDTKTLKWAMESWFEERKPVSKTQYEWRRIIAGFGEDRLIQALTFEDIRNYKAVLLKKGQRSNTVDKKLTGLRTVLRWAFRNGHVSHDPTVGVRVEGLNRRRRKERKRQSYTLDEARKLLRAARKETGALRWATWLMAATGCRIQEACQAFTNDIRRESGIPYLHITAKGDGQSLKTAESERRVPLHPDLIKEGFLKFVEERPHDSRLFPGIRPDRFGNWGAQFGKKYGRWARSLVPDATKVAHSWRHSFKTRAREAGIPEDIHDRLTGHVGGGVGRDYGTISLKALATAIKRIDFGAQNLV